VFRKQERHARALNASARGFRRRLVMGVAQYAPYPGMAYIPQMEKVL
jgi:hypothetical protein